MELKGKLLTYFVAIVLIVLVTFGLIAYQIAYESGIEKEHFLLRGIVALKAETLSTEYTDDPSIDHLNKYIQSDQSTDHISFLIDDNNNIVIAGMPTIHGSDHRTFPYKQILEADTFEGHLTFNDQLYLWAVQNIQNSPYKLLHIFRSVHDVSISFTSLAERMVVSGIIIVWIAVWVALVISTAVTRRLDAQTKALEYQASHDSLTGLPNRGVLEERLEKAINMAQRQNKYVSLIIMDLDRFKEINDTLGHHVGDLILQKIAKRLSKILKKTDTIARLGGDEFAILLPMTDASHAMLVVDKILMTMEQPFIIEDSSLEVDASLGIAYYPRHGEDATTLMRRADIAMYLAKHSGDTFAIYDHEKDPHSLRRLTLIGELRHASERDELQLYYQPKIDIKTGAIVGVEALLYWQHPQHGLMSPNSFIPLAEQTGIIKSLTLWSLHTAVSQCATWHKANLPVSVSVNLSAKVLQDLQFPAQVSAILKNQELAPECLELEITETAIMVDPIRAREILARLDAMGVRLAIDDFGTGYTSLSYLKQLPVDEIKIDKSFVMGMLKDENDAMIVRSIIDLSHNMGYEVVAEGVESKSILDELENLQCDIAQGFYFAKPLPNAEIEQILTDLNCLQCYTHKDKLKRSQPQLV